MNARKVSKSLRDVIDSRKVDYSRICIDIDEKSIRLELDDVVYNYSDEHFQKIALKNLENVLKSVKNVEDLHVVFYESTPKIMFELFSKIMENTKFDVGRIHVLVDRHEDAL
ncbi:hypothetical protein B9Z55_021108 [Caenorhabditis nigoni]|nr:hypothetical protein B9Z55_021108 [Caenorhabditis nigoni]